jgi:hypothetical protein
MSPPTHGVRRNYNRTTHATAPCKDCDQGSKGERRVEGELSTGSNNAATADRDGLLDLVIQAAPTCQGTTAMSVEVVGSGIRLMRMI